MAYQVNGKVYTEHALMDEVVYHTKMIMRDIVIKNTIRADEFETEETIQQADYLIAIKQGTMELGFFPFTIEMLTAYGYTPLQAADIIHDRERIPEEHRDSLLSFCSEWFLAHFEEKNFYYRMLAGLPEYGTDQYNVYVDPNDPRLSQIAVIDMDLSAPIHTYNINQLNALTAVGIFDEILESHAGIKYRYLKHLTGKKIDVYTARIAAQWDILYIPDVEYLVRTRFKELYAINRDIYYRRTYQEAYKAESDYFDEACILMILAQTFTDMVTELPEWYIRRDIFDLRTVQYFLDSQGVKFFKEIPLKYQIRIVKNLNKLIKYKSTNTSIHDILEIFGVEGTTVYKYYLFKDYLYNIHDQEIPIPPKPEPWTMEKEYDLGDEEVDNIIRPPEEDMYFGEEGVDIFYHEEDVVQDYNFLDEGSDIPLEGSETDEQIESQERQKIITDEYGNVYRLRFIRVPIGESYDDYMKDNVYQEEYDTVTRLDQYWDGEDVHSYITNRHLEKDFTIEGTKYMFLDYKLSYEEYNFQMSYFLGMIFSSAIDTNDITIAVPQIHENMYFPLTDLFILLYCLSCTFEDSPLDIRRPQNIRTGQVPPFQKYNIINGGWFFDGGEPPQPEPEPEDPRWKMDIDYNFGDEERDTIKDDPLYLDIYDFGFQNENVLTYDTELQDYDFEEITPYTDESGVPYEPEDWDVDVPKMDEGTYDPNNPEITDKDFFERMMEHYYEGDDWILGPYYDYWDEIEGYHLLQQNFIGDSPDKDYYDETQNEDFMPIYYWNRIYDYNDEDLFYVPPAPPKPTVPYKWWINIEPHPFELDVDGRFPNNDGHYSKRYDGGRGIRYTEITRDSFYDWMRTDNPQLFVPVAGRIYGFNLNVDLEEVKRNIGIRHSSFEWDHGYTLEDFGLQDFIATDKIESIDDMIYIYNTNREAYHNLEKHMEETINTRDELVTMNYLFNTLFTVPYDLGLYTVGGSGDMLTSYDEVLRHRNLVLYNFYKDVIKDSDPETRKDTVRAALNDIVSILEYYLSSDYIEHVFSFVPTYSLNAITEYIQMMIDFFKSWKVYFLEPRVTFTVNDRNGNKVMQGDQIVETRISLWSKDAQSYRDKISMVIHRSFKEEFEVMKYEVLDINAYRVQDVTKDDYLDGGYPEWNETWMKGEERFQGGYVYEVNCTPFRAYDGGWIRYRKQLYVLDGAGPMEMINCGKVEGGWIMDEERNHYPMLNDFTTPIYEVDGGTVGRTMTNTFTVATNISKGQIRSVVILSGYRKNDLQSRPNGLYLGKQKAVPQDITDFENELTYSKNQYMVIRMNCLSEIAMLGDQEQVNNRVDLMIDTLIKEAQEDQEELEEKMKIMDDSTHADEAFQDICDWFNDYIASLEEQIEVIS